MEEKENVYVEKTDTEQIAAANQGTGDCSSQKEKGLAVLGKFKDVDALARAYESLQAEFTRRSQRLKELERATENCKKDLFKGSDSATAVEKLRKSAESIKEKQRAFDGFVAELEKASIRADQPTERTEEQPVASESVAARKSNGGEEIALEIGGQGAPVAENRESVVLSSDELFARASRDESVRLKIIGEYLSSVGKSVVPLTRSGVGVTTPPLKAKTVEEAGTMALRWLKNNATV